MTHVLGKKLCLILVPFVISACGNSTPTCNSSSVISVLKEQLITATKNMQAAILMNGISGAFQFDGAYEKLKIRAQNDKQAKTALGELDKTLKDVSFDFENILPTGIDDKIMKVSCAAQMKISGQNGIETKPITYSAQKSSDGLIIEIQ